MKIAVIGTGYVGLVSGTCFAETGNNVICVDIDAGKVKRLSNGEITIYEPGLEKIFLRNLKEGRLSFTTNLAESIKDAKIIFLALPTPPGEDGSAAGRQGPDSGRSRGRPTESEHHPVQDKTEGGAAQGVGRLSK